MWQARSHFARHADLNNDNIVDDDLTFIEAMFLRCARPG